MIKCKNCSAEFSKKEIKQSKEHFLCPYCYDYLIPINNLKDVLIKLRLSKRF